MFVEVFLGDVARRPKARVECRNMAKRIRREVLEMVELGCSKEMVFTVTKQLEAAKQLKYVVYSSLELSWYFHLLWKVRNVCHSIVLYLILVQFH